MRGVRRYGVSGAARSAVRRGGGEEGLAIGVSAPVGLAAAAVAFKQADQALSVARRRGVALVEHEDVAAGSVLPLLADDAVRAFADGLLRARCGNTTRTAGVIWWRRCAPGCPGTGSGTRRRRSSGCTATRCGTACAGWRRSWAALSTTRTVRMELWLALKATG